MMTGSQDIVEYVHLPLTNAAQFPDLPPVTTVRITDDGYAAIGDIDFDAADLRHILSRLEAHRDDSC